MEVWQLEDDYGSVVWYEKSNGFLVNGTFIWGVSWYEKFEFEGINFGNAAIPGFNCIFLIGLLLVSAIVVLKNITIRNKLFVSY